MRLGHLLDEAHATAQLLGRRDALVQPGDNIICQRLALLDALADNHIRARDLGVLLLVPDADDADIGDVLAADELGLELGGRDLKALCSCSQLLEHIVQGSEEKHVLYLMSSFMRSVM